MITKCVGTEKEKIKQEFADYIGGLNSCGIINYSDYSQLFDFTMRLFDELNEKAFKELLKKLKSSETYISDEGSIFTYNDIENAINEILKE